MRKLVIILLLSINLYNAFSNDFQNANREYANKNYLEAKELYLEDINNRGYSFNTLYNLGNLLHNQGENGQALYWYKKAQVIEPRSRDLNGIIKGLENDLNIKTKHPTLFISRNENLLLTLLLILIISLSIFTFTVFKVKKCSIKILKYKNRVLIFTAAILLLSLSGNIYYVINSNTATVLLDSEVLQSPYSGSSESFSIKSGYEVKTGDSFEGFIQITDNNKRFGWIKSNNIGYIWKR